MENVFFYIAGLLLLALAKAKSLLWGYSAPNAYDFSQIQRCVDYDIQVVDDWLSHLRSYDETFSLKHKNVLEIGPTSDLGIGLYLLTKGCFQYNACDVDERMKTAPDELYRQLFSQLSRYEKQGQTQGGKPGEKQQTADFLKQQLAAAKAGYPSRLNIIVRDEVDLVAAFGPATVDVVFSQMALEHFDDIDRMATQLSVVCKPDAVLIAHVNLTLHSRWGHSRWMHAKDPNNIYRYPQSLYDLFEFRGIHNRLRPFQYQAAFERAGWTNLSIYPISQLKKPAVSGFHKQFATAQNQMDYLSIMICARNGDG